MTEIICLHILALVLMFIAGKPTPKVGRAKDGRFFSLKGNKHV